MAQPKKFIAQERGYRHNINWHTPMVSLADFNSGDVGVNAVNEVDGWSSGGGRSFYAENPDGSGTNVCITSIEDGLTGTQSNQVGGYLHTNNGFSGFKRGDVVSVGADIFFPVGFDLAAVENVPPNGRQKFFRVGSYTSSGESIGFVDLYIVRNPDAAGEGCQFQLIKEGELGGVSWRNVGSRADDIVYGVWESYQMRIWADNLSEDEGGAGRVDFFKNGERVDSVTNVRTINAEDDKLENFLCFTYWDDRGASATQSWFIDDAFIRNGDPDGADSQGNARFNQ